MPMTFVLWQHPKSVKQLGSHNFLMKADSNKIAKNTIFLYARKALSLVIALYTSRIVLEMLGVTEFGIYGLVGSIVAMFSALRGLFATSVQRFINISKGENPNYSVGKIFSIGLKIHLWIALCFFIIVEISGWFMIPHLNIPVNNYAVAQWVLLFSVLSAVFSILTAPYDALIIANEDFKAYSIISIFEYVLRLGIVFLLVYSPMSRVVFYSILLFLVSLIIRFINTWYCRSNYGMDAKYRNVKDRSLMIKMTKFAGWQFFGNLGYTLTNNGVNFIINIFGGVIVNAARTIAYQVMQALQQFINDINVSFQPQSMILYADNQKDAFLKLIILNSKASISIAILLSFPVLMLTYPILHLWLGSVPEYAVGFVQSIMIYLIIRSIHGPIDMIFKCSGDLKRYQLTECIIMTFNLPLSWLALYFGFPYYCAFIIMGVVETINLAAILLIAKYQLNFNLSTFCSKVIMPSSILCLIMGFLFFTINSMNLIDESIGALQLIFISGASVCFVIMIELLILFNSAERTRLMHAIISHTRHKSAK